MFTKTWPSEEDFNNQMHRMTPFVDTSQLLSMTTPTIVSIRNKVTMMAGIVIMHVLNNMGFHSPDQPSYNHC